MHSKMQEAIVKKVASTYSHYVCHYLRGIMSTTLRPVPDVLSLAESGDSLLQRRNLIACMERDIQLPKERPRGSVRSYIIAYALDFAVLGPFERRGFRASDIGSVTTDGTRLNEA